MRKSLIYFLIALVIPIGLVAPSWATITKVQGTTATSGTVTLNGVASGNLLVFVYTYYRATGTGLATTVPTDTNGTFSTAVNDAPPTCAGTSHDCGLAIFYIQNAAAGTHSVTMPSETISHASFTEFTPVVASGAFDTGTSAKTNASAHTSQVTGTTAATTQNLELVVIGCTQGASTGSADVGWTDPVSGFTTLFKIINSSTDLALLHAYKVISTTGTQAATFNWTSNVSDIGTQAAIATFKEASSSIVLHNFMLLGVGP